MTDIWDDGPGVEGKVAPLPTPEALAGGRLDADHPPEVRPPMLACVVCGFGTDDSFERPLRHYPEHHELARVELWLQTYRPRADS